MSIQELTPNNALISGSDLWVLPQSTESDWVHKIDWHCNFQLEKTKYKELKFLSEKIKSIAIEEDFDIADIRSGEKAPVMLVGGSYLPCEYIVQLKPDSPEEWVSTVNQLSKSLLKNRIRVFLPQNISKSDFYSLAEKKLDAGKEVSIVGS